MKEKVRRGTGEGWVGGELTRLADYTCTWGPRGPHIHMYIMQLLCSGYEAVTWRGGHLRGVYP